MLSKIADFPVRCYVKKSLELQALRIFSNMMPQQLDEIDQGDSFAVLLIAF